MRTFLDVFKGWLSLLALAVVISGCGGGSGGTALTSISGTAATGAALAGTIELVDANGVVRSNQPILAGGAFTIDTTGLAPPFILRATGSGNDAGIILYSLADGVTGIFNITPLTHLALELLRQDDGAGAPADLAALFAAWNAQVDPADLAGLQAALLQAQARINANLAAQFQANGLTPTDFDFLRTAFVPGQPGIDAVLDLISGLTIAGNTITMNVGGSPFAFNFTIDIAGFNIGGGNAGGGGGGNGGGAGVLTCDTTLFQANAVHAASAQELADFAGNYTGEVYTDDGAGNFTPSAGTAAFDANGVLTLNGQAKTATSICVDNVAGVYGTVLYVHFADGHVDLFANDTFSGSISAPAGGGGAAGSLTLSIMAGGVASADINLNGITKPTTQAEFCADMTSNSSTSLSNALGAVGTFTVNSCSFNGSVGNVSATLAVAGVGSIPYTVVYTYN